MSKLTDHDISLIAELRKTLSTRAIAAKFDVSQPAIVNCLRASVQQKKLNRKLLKAIKSDITNGICTTTACEKHNVSTHLYQSLNKTLSITRRGVAA
ncbi:hypothetical protein [Pseudoalteromonas sp. 1181_04]|uniref:hypothetical protein n=1 Tax=Pseudoalteromonas sp. 1181_04 TaxID=2604450 RepID=UPI0040640BD4